MGAAEDMGTAVCLIEMRFGFSEAEGAADLLLSVVERIEVKTGCEACSVVRDMTDPARILYTEVWTSEPLFRAHVKSREFRNVLVAMDMCRSRPQVVVGKLQGPTGIGFLRELRCGLEPVQGAGPVSDHS